jgi:hypothetical protein
MAGRFLYDAFRDSGWTPSASCSALGASTLPVVLVQKSVRSVSTPKIGAGPTDHSVFIGQSFPPTDEVINKFVFDVLTSIGRKAATGEKPKADRISEEIKGQGLIEQQAIFVGIFKRRNKIARKREWTTGTWVIDEKAYDLGRQKSLMLLNEQDVTSIGVIQSDYEYFEFSRERLEVLAIKFVNLLSITNNGLVR